MYIGVSASQGHRQRQSVEDCFLKRVKACTVGENVNGILRECLKNNCQNLIKILLISLTVVNRKLTLDFYQELFLLLVLLIFV